eukprot:TRINITY_DN594_c0_g2_i1.p1 TRINITY_DN594_c0_g2~~TRINITY_DN594_c0_g2_i1.p1  ORF type:complete len:319 (-),score=64.18 TRINITY_DN594_c0_g2_i1:151-1107(-)
MNTSCVLCVLFVCFSMLLVNGAYHKRVQLRDVDTLVFRRGEMTTNRRVPAVPQLHCDDQKSFNRFCDEVDFSSAICKNQGGGNSPVWECRAELPSGVRFGPVSVICEGYSSSEDEYVLDGSCALEYSLLRDRSAPYHSSSYPESEYNDEESFTKTSSWGLGSWILIGILCYVIYLIFSSCSHRSGNGDGGGGFSGEGFHPGPGDSSSSFPSSSSPPPSWTPSSSCNTTYSTYPSSTAYPQAPVYTTSPSSSSGPGFWSGMVGGGILGYLWGRRNTSSSSYSYPQQPSYRTSTNTSPFSSRSYSSSSSSRVAFADTRKR